MRMRSTAANAPSAGHSGMALHFAEHPRGQDDQIGHIFRSMRSAMNVSRETIARRLATSTATIDSFEAGSLPGLPHWKETARIIRGYCEMLRIDPEPLLWRMREQFNRPASPARPDVGAPQQSRPAAPWARPKPPPDATGARPERTKGRARPRRRAVHMLFAASAPITIAAAVAILTQVAPGPMYRGIGMLPSLIATPVRAGLDHIVVLTAPKREGLKWIEVGDPRLRKADKLQTSTR